MILMCERSTDVPQGMALVRTKNGGALFRRADASRARSTIGRPRRSSQTQSLIPDAARDWNALIERFTVAMTADERHALAVQLGVTAMSLEAFGVGHVTGKDLSALRARWEGDPPISAYTFPERDGSGRVIGLSLRAPDGRKSTPSGSKRGLTVPWTLKDRPDPVLIVEGASDVAACESLGLAAVGRPSNAAGAEHLSVLLEDRDIIVLGENDQKSDGSWPGRVGAKAVAQRIAAMWATTVKRALPPTGFKDVRSWLQSRVSSGLSLSDEAACKAAGADLLLAVQAAARETKAEKLSQAELLVRLAQERYRIGLAGGDEPFAVEHDGPNVALMFRGSRDALRSALSREFRRRYRATPSASALADALTALQGEAHECTPEPVHLRLAEHDGAIVMDLGDASGRVVVVRPAGWSVEHVSPVLFRRTALTGVLPEPIRGGSLDLLRGLVNVVEDSWSLMLGWLVSALIPWIPHPILMLGGMQGSGKTYAGKCLVGLFDPSPAILRSQPKDSEQWAMAAAGSYGVLLDNVSSIAQWWSDALCRASTGDGWVRRRLYTDGELSVLSFRRVIVLTSIDAGALKGDLGERLILLDLAQILKQERRPERELDQLFAEHQPLIFGALLDLAAAVLRKLGTVKPDGLPRMADLGEVLAAMDAVLGTDSLRRYEAQSTRIASEVVEADPVGMAVVTQLERAGMWSGTAQELLDAIKPEKPGSEWPKTGRGRAGRLRRLIPALLSCGVKVTPPAPTDKTRRFVLETIAQTAQPPDDGPGDGVNGDDGREVDESLPPNRPVDRSPETGLGAAVDAVSGRSGDSGGYFHDTSDDGVSAGPGPRVEPDDLGHDGRSTSETAEQLAFDGVARRLDPDAWAKR